MTPTYDLQLTTYDLRLTTYNLQLMTVMKRMTLIGLPLLLTVLALGVAGFKAKVPGEKFARFEMAQLLAQLKDSGRPYLPFLNESTLRCGIYKLAAGATDEQEPHQLDEVYYVLKGKGKFRAGEVDTAFNPGDVLFVAARVEHQFHEISEDLELLVFFSTAKPD